MFSVQIDFTNLDAALLRAKSFMENECAKQAAPEIIEWIQKRTAQGLDDNNKSFKVYAPAYAKRREKNHLGTAPVDLNWSGAMLRLEYNDSTHRITPPQDAMGRAKGHQYGYSPKKLPKREWMGVTKDESKLIGKQLSLNLKKYILQ